MQLDIIFKPDESWQHTGTRVPGFLKLLLSGKSVRVYVSAVEASNN